MQSLLYVIATIIIMIVTLIHEYGHFIVARKYNVFVKTFSVGFGKTLWSVKSNKSGTVYKISAIPLGGYVEPIDQESLDNMKRECLENGGDIDELNKLNGHTMDDASPWQRFLIAVAGPLANFIFAAFLFVCVYCCIGLKEYRVLHETDDVLKYGLRQNDIIGQYSKNKNNDNVLLVSRSGDGIQRIIVSDVPDEIKNTSDFVNKILNKDSNAIDVIIQRNPAILLATILTKEYVYTKLTAKGLVKIFTFSKESRQNTGGFASIISFISKQACSGFVGAMDAIILISIMLGAFNVMPIIPLDGGRMVIELYQIISRKTLHKSAEKYINIIGISVILFLFAYSNIMDIIRFLFW